MRSRSPFPFPILLARLALLIFGLCMVSAPADAADGVLPAAPLPAPAYEAIDQYALQTPDNYTDSIPHLAEYLVRPAHNDSEKARAIFRWITSHLAYDVDGIASGRLEQRPDVVLNNRCTDCGGYAMLFARLAQAAGLEAVVIAGVERQLEVDPMLARLSRGPHYASHAWNAVRIEGHWMLLDCTADAGFAWRRGHREIARPFDDFYFLTPPDRFVYDHLPNDPTWQLLEKPLSRAEQNALPFLQPAFFRYGMGLDSARGGVVYADPLGLAEITLKAPPGCILTASLRRDGSPLARRFTFVQRNGDRYEISAMLPAAGDYVLRLGAKHAGDTEFRDWVMDYEIRASPGAAERAGFPMAYGDFESRGAHLYGPGEAVLRPAPQSFKIAVPGADSVVVLNGGQLIPLALQDGSFNGVVSLAPGEAVLAARFPENPGIYRSLVRYQVGQ